MSTRKGTTWREVEAALDAYMNAANCVGYIDGYRGATQKGQDSRELYERSLRLWKFVGEARTKLERTIRAYAKAQARKALTRR